MLICLLLSDTHSTTSLPSSFFFSCAGHTCLLPSPPPRRSSDLGTPIIIVPASATALINMYNVQQLLHVVHVDRKSTRLNSSHGSNSYAVFCLKKKKNKSNEYLLTTALDYSCACTRASSRQQYTL